jgi:hypothetical protein
MWGYLTLLGVTRIAVGSVEAHKADLDKELVSDFLRNAAMRFGIALALWTKVTSNLQQVVNAHRQTETLAPAVLVKQPQNVRTQALGAAATNAPSEAQLKYLRGLNYEGPAPETRAECTALIKRLAP